MSGCVLDTDVLIAALDRRDLHHSAASAAVTALIDGEVPLLLSLVNYAEALVRPAERQDTLRIAQDALRAIGVQLIMPTAAIALDAARHRALKVSLADGFALATAQAYDASIATFGRRVRRVLPKLGLRLSPALSGNSWRAP